MLNKNDVLIKDKLITTAKDIESEIKYSDFDNNIKINQIYAQGQYYIYDDESIELKLDELEIELNKDPNSISYHLYKSIHAIVNNDYRYDLLNLLPNLTLFQFNYEDNVYDDDDFYGYEDESLKLNIDNEKFIQCMDESDLENENKTLKVILDFEVSINYANKQTNYFTISDVCESDSLNKIKDKNIMLLANKIIEILDLDFNVENKNNNAFNIEESYDIDILIDELSHDIYKRLERECKDIFLANSVDVVFMFGKNGAKIKYFNNCVNEYTRIAVINQFIEQITHGLDIKIDTTNVLADYPKGLIPICSNEYQANELINYKDIIIENFKNIINWDKQTQYGDYNLCFKLNKGLISRTSEVGDNRIICYNKNDEIIMVINKDEIQEYNKYTYTKVDELINKVNSLISAYGK